MCSMYSVGLKKKEPPHNSQGVGLGVPGFGVCSLWCKLGTFRSDYDYEYDYNFWAREAWVSAVVDTVVAVVSSQQKYFSNFCQYEVITFLSVAGMFSRQTIQDATKSPKHCETSCRNISQCMCATNFLTRLCTCSELVVGGRDSSKIS